MRPEEINRNINLAFKRFSRRGNPFHFVKCKKHLEKRLEWFRATDPEEVLAKTPRKSSSVSLKRSFVVMMSPVPGETLIIH